MKLITLEGEYYAKSEVGKGYDSEFFTVECVYPFDLNMNEDEIDRKKRQRAFMFIRNFALEEAVKESLKEEGKLKYFGGSIRTCSITDVKDISVTELKKPKYKKLRDSISYVKGSRQKIIKPAEVTYDDIMSFSTPQIVFCLMSISDPSKEDPTQLVSRHMHDLKKGKVEAKRKMLAKYLKLEPAEVAEVPQEMTISDEDIFDNEKVVATPKSKSKDSLEVDADLEAAAGL